MKIIKKIIKSSIKIMKNAFYLMFKFLSRIFGHVEKTA